MTDWNRKLSAWLHDPIEKALILMRTRDGHEAGTVRALRERLGIDLDQFDRRADWLASAADRPNWPRPADARYPQWEQVRFTKDPVLIHPMSGESLVLPPMADIDPDVVADASRQHFERLIHPDDSRKTFLSFWRFGAALGQNANDEVGDLWRLLPADSRTPDHSIWQHVDLVSALHTALEGEDVPALLTLSLGPVQSFIAEARSTSDLWAGSHLLARLAWAAAAELAGTHGPDCVLFPALRGLPLADAWLLEDEQLGHFGRDLFNEFDRAVLEHNDDRNPLFVASLPNKILAIVPSHAAPELAAQMTRAVRDTAAEIAGEAADRVFSAANRAMTHHTRTQIARQLEGFPELHWSAVRWDGADAGTDLANAALRLREALASIHPHLAEKGVFDLKYWEPLSRSIEVDGFQFWRPNAGVFYPAVYSLAESGLAAAKATHIFGTATEGGYRCTLCGVREWLSESPDELHVAPGRRREGGEADTVWTALADKIPAWSKAGEHLCALCCAKRLWPSVFTDFVACVTGHSSAARRFVVSTHALARSTTIERLALADISVDAQAAISSLSGALDEAQLPAAILPSRLVARLSEHPDRKWLLDIARKLPAAFELAQGPGDPEEDGDRQNRRVPGTDITLSALERCIWEATGARAETYYAMVALDGDHMGAWLRGDSEHGQLTFRDTWHPGVRAKVDEFGREHPALAAYAGAPRPSSPARHAAISTALAAYSTHVVRHVVEECCNGRLLYAGGDDVLAMVAVHDLFDLLMLLRLAYSGIGVPQAHPLSSRVGRFDDALDRPGRRLALGHGYARLNGRLMTMMGPGATVSAGAVIAHHQAPLARVLRELRDAESKAKQAGRDRFAIRVLKRGGGAVGVVAPWWPYAEAGSSVRVPQPKIEQALLSILGALRVCLAADTLSRSALYRTSLWLEGLSDAADDAGRSQWREQAAGSILAQFRRGTGDQPGLAAELPGIVQALVDHVCGQLRPSQPRTALAGLLSLTEFLARNARAPRVDGDEGNR